MNNYDFLKNEQKNQTLVLVEGKHEKKTLLSILLACFPEVPILSDNIHVYEADIYDLYHDIEVEYEEDWYENDLEIDIPLLISRRHNIEPQLKKNNFTNIILIFDYEHHDIWFKDEKIERMQNHFNSMNGHDHGDAFAIVDNIPYYTVNSATYVWCGSQIVSSEALKEKYDYLHGMLLYKQALYVDVEIDDKEIRIQGMVWFFAC